jgi:uncharacterized protein YjbI with pentapeptide repeats
MKFEIKHRYTGEVLCEIEAESLKLAVEAATKAGIDLSYADLRDAYMAGADLCRAYLPDAYLSNANLTGADLSNANLRGADLYGADLSNADLYGADLGEADLRRANLRHAKNIPDTYKRIVRDDIWAILSSAPTEVEGLRQAIIDGKIDGTTYKGDCACLVGTIANIKGVDYTTLNLIKPDSNRPAEQWFLHIKKGDTPEANEFAGYALDCVDQWLANMQAAFGGAK